MGVFHYVANKYICTCTVSAPFFFLSTVPVYHPRKPKKKPHVPLIEDPEQHLRNLAVRYLASMQNISKVLNLTPSHSPKNLQGPPSPPSASLSPQIS
jgi:hypothetical protein